MKSTNIFGWRSIACFFVGLAGLTPATAATYPVKVTDYGAKCDGKTDDSTSIQNAITGAGPGGTVQFPAGKCYVSGNTSIVVNEVTLVGAGTPRWSEESPSNIGGVGTSILIGLPPNPAISGDKGVAPGSKTPFFLQHSFTIRGMSFQYPYTIANANGQPPADPPLFSDDGSNGSGDALFEDLTVIAPYIFWRQSQPANGIAPTYGNIKFNNVNVYATYEVFEWDNIQEQVVLNNFLSNPSLCGGGPNTTCKDGLKNWTGANGRWFHVVGTGNATTGRPAAGMATQNTVVVAYSIGVLIDNNGQMDESIFGPTTVWDAVPTILDVEPTGSITHSIFNGKSQSDRHDFRAPLFKLNNPQHPLAGSNNNDDNSLDLNGFNSDGSENEFLFLDASGANASFGSINVSGAVIRDFCKVTPTNGIYINGNVKYANVVGSQVTTGVTGCGNAINVTSSVQHAVVANNLVYPN